MSKQVKDQGPKPAPAPNTPVGTHGPGVRSKQDFKK